MAAFFPQEVPHSEPRLARTYDGDLESIVGAVFDLVCHIEASSQPALPTRPDCRVSDTPLPTHMPQNIAEIRGSGAG